MDTAVIGVSAGRQARHREVSSRCHRSRIEQAGTVVPHAVAVGDGMVGWRRIIPANGRAARHGGGGRTVIGRSVLHQNLCGRGEVQGGSTCGGSDPEGNRHDA